MRQRIVSPARYVMNTPSKSALLLLENDYIFPGTSVGCHKNTQSEIIFNTSMTGYQEVLTDPSYANQLIVFTSPHIGNIGVNDEDQESAKVWPAGIIIHHLSPTTSNWRAQQSFQDYLFKNNLICITDVDTRQLTQMLRERGSQVGTIIIDDAIDSYKQSSTNDLTSLVSTKTSYEWPEKNKNSSSFHLVIYDFGVKISLLNSLSERGCKLTVVPANTPAINVLALNPDGIVLSSGPGDPATCTYAIETINELLKLKIPLLGVCFGYQLLALASHARIIKMKCGHHGINHPIINLETKQISITTQNHGYCIDENTLPATLKPTHRSLLDNSIQGIMRIDAPALGLQGHPEAGPGPREMNTLFYNFFQFIKIYKMEKENVGYTKILEPHD